MTFVPTKARQKKWIKDRLNGGVCPENREEWVSMRFSGYSLTSTSAAGMMACYEALEWLAESNIRTLEEAWRQCDNPAWLLWCIAEMEPKKSDFDKSVLVIRYLLRRLNSLSGVLQQDLNMIGKACLPSRNNQASSLALRDLLCHLNAYNVFYSDAEWHNLAKFVKRTWGNPWKLKKR